MWILVRPGVSFPSPGCARIPTSAFASPMLSCNLPQFTLNPTSVHTSPLPQTSVLLCKTVVLGLPLTLWLAGLLLPPPVKPLLWVALSAVLFALDAAMLFRPEALHRAVNAMHHQGLHQHPHRPPPADPSQSQSLASSNLGGGVLGPTQPLQQQQQQGQGYSEPTQQQREGNGRPEPARGPADPPAQSECPPAFWSSFTRRLMGVPRVMAVLALAPLVSASGGDLAGTEGCRRLMGVPRVMAMLALAPLVSASGGGGLAGTY